MIAGRLRAPLTNEQSTALSSILSTLQSYIKRVELAREVVVHLITLEHSSSAEIVAPDSHYFVSFQLRFITYCILNV